MKVFKVKASNYSYCDYISIVVVAESEERALEIAMKQNYERKEKEDYFEFDDWQLPLIVAEINTEIEQVIEASNLGA